MADIVKFLLQHLPEEDWSQLDEHSQQRFAYQYAPPSRPGDVWVNNTLGCAACSQSPGPDGETPYGRSWIELWPCRHLCKLALRYGDQPGFHVYWLERLTFGTQPFT